MKKETGLNFNTVTPYVPRQERLVCEIQGTRCLNNFIKTRHEQPNICLRCLDDLRIKRQFKVIQATKKLKI